MKTVLAISGLFLSATAFAGTGLVTTPFPGGREGPRTIHAVPNNKLVAVGFYGSTNHGGLARYLSNGALDVSFGGNGKVGILAGTTETGLFEFDTANQKIVAVGNFKFGTCLSPIILRYNDNGTLDTSFGGQGMVFPIIGTCTDNLAGYLTDVKIDGSNRVVVAGVSSTGHAVVARFSWSGNPDNSFGTQGVFDVTQAVKNVGENSTNLSVKSLRLADGEIIVAGTTNGQAMVARITGIGLLDVQFGFGGVVVLPPYSTNGQGPSVDEWTWAKPLSDDSILVAGDSQYLPMPISQCSGGWEAPVSEIVIGHYLLNGLLDTSYGGNGTGRASRQFSSSDIQVDGALDSEGRLVVGAAATNLNPCTGVTTVANYLAVRFTSTGLLDTSFNGGSTQFAFTANPVHLDYAFSITVDSTDRPVLLGSPDGIGFGLGCLTTGGVLDTTFGP